MVLLADLQIVEWPGATSRQRKRTVSVIEFDGVSVAAGADRRRSLIQNPGCNSCSLFDFHRPCARHPCRASAVGQATGGQAGEVSGEHTRPRVLVSAPSPKQSFRKFARARAPSPAPEPGALPGIARVATEECAKRQT